MNTAVADQELKAPSSVARTRQVCRLPNSSWFATRKDGPSDTPPPTLAFASLKTSNSYCTARPVLVCVADAVSVGLRSFAVAPLMGDRGTGGGAFSVDPSGAASAVDGEAAVGVAGVVLSRPQAVAAATATAN